MENYNKTLRHLLFYVSMFIGTCSSYGQSSLSYSFTFSNTPLEVALIEINNKTPYSIRYKEQWVDSVMVTGQYQNLSIDSLLNALLKPSGLNYTILNKSIILTGDVKIIEGITYDTSSVDAQQPKYIFDREFRGNSGQEVIAIGSRAKMKSGAKALVVGFIKNAETGEPIQSAVVFKEGSQINTSTNEKGFYSLSLLTGDHVIGVQYAGMKSTKQPIVLFSDGNLNLSIEEEPQILQEVTITSDQNANVSNVRMGSASLNMEELKNVPKILGENDMIQAALTLPGVQNVGEGSAGINVRGGKTDQNLIQLNNATIYNPFHFFGFFSSFNADITSSSELIKSGIPASYGGRLSSLLNVKMKKANKDRVSGKIGLNPITTKASIEIPIIKEKTSLMAGGRTTYSDWVIKRVPNEDFKKSKPAFSDFAINLNHSYGESNSINLSGYYSTDKFKLSTDSTNNYSNINASLEWSHLINSKLSSTLIAGATNYQFSIDYDAQPESAFDYGFEIEERFGKFILNYFPSDIHDIQAGTDIKIYNLQPGKIEPKGISDIASEKIQNEKGIERSVFLSDEFKLSQKISLYGGLRYSFFSPIGNRTINYYQQGLPKNSATRVSSKEYASGEVIDTYHGPELRFSGKYSLNNKSSIKLGVTQMRQYIHAISSTVSVAPTDTWKLSDPNFAPQKSLQYSVGYYRDLFNKDLELSIETYYKDLKNLLDYKIGADLVLNQNLETEVIQGKGRAYGLEFLLKKPLGKLNGWVSYTFSKSQQKFASDFAENRINNGNYFSSNFEKPHDLSVVANYKYTRRYSFSMNVVYSSGRPITYPTGQYTLSGIEITHFSERNGYRIPNYFRVDLSVNIEGSHKVNKIGHGYWSISIYNVLARKNVYSVFFSNDNGTIKGYELSVLGTAIPSITYNIKL